MKNSGEREKRTRIARGRRAGQGSGKWGHLRPVAPTGEGLQEKPSHPLAAWGLSLACEWQVKRVVQAVLAQYPRGYDFLYALASNAMDALEGRALESEREGEDFRPLLLVDADPEEGWVRVTDNGPGIPIQRARSMAGPFAAMRIITPERRGGHGTDLSMVVFTHDRVEVESRHGGEQFLLSYRWGRAWIKNGRSPTLSIERKSSGQLSEWESGTSVTVYLTPEEYEGDRALSTGDLALLEARLRYGTPLGVVDLGGRKSDFLRRATARFRRLRCGVTLEEREVSLSFPWPHESKGVECLDLGEWTFSTVSPFGMNADGYFRRFGTEDLHILAGRERLRELAALMPYRPRAYLFFGNPGVLRRVSTTPEGTSASPLRPALWVAVNGAVLPQPICSFDYLGEFGWEPFLLVELEGPLNLDVGHRHLDWDVEEAVLALRPGLRDYLECLKTGGEES